MFEILRLPSVQQSLWQVDYPAASYPALDDDLSIDVAIVGGGITGLTTAYLLKKAGFSVAVLEMRTVGAGTTGRTTGKVTSQHGLVYAELEQQRGFVTARRYGEAYQAAVKQLDDIVRRERIRCDWQQETNYVFTADRRRLAAFQAEAAVAARLGLPASFTMDTPLPFRVEAAVAFAGQAKINAQRYILGLAQLVDGGGSYVFEHSHVIAIHDGSPGQVRTRHGTVSTKHIVVATNVPTLPLLARVGYCIKEYPTESYVVAGRFGRKLPGMYISPDKRHFSILPVESARGQLLLVGGMAHLPGLGGNQNDRYHTLANYAERRFGVRSIEYRWSDRDYLAYDRLPLIGPLYSWSKQLYVATAFKKWGLSGGTLAAMLLRDRILGQPNDWAELFDSTRGRPVTQIPRAIVGYLRGQR